MRTPPHNWILADVENIDQGTLQKVAQFISEEGLETPGVLGPNRYVEEFISEWKALKNINGSVHMNELIYQLDEVKVNPSSEGKLIHATEKNHDLLSKWLIQFGKEANETITKMQAENLATNFINNQSGYLWLVNGQIVSMANRSRKTKNGATINAVFTPDEYKCNGYGTSIVAALSQKILGEGFQFCSLYTDLSNPTSNSIYKKIGYYEVGSSIVYHFEK